MRAHEFYKINVGNALSICGARIVAMTFQPSGKKFRRSVAGARGTAGDQNGFVPLRFNVTAKLFLFNRFPLRLVNHLDKPVTCVR
jgi:hypothetical protein